MSTTTAPRIVTNFVPRDVIDAYELTTTERARFDYLDWSAIERGEDSASFFRYKGQVLDLSEFERATGPELVGWDGMRADSFFSGLVVRYVDDFERVIVGLYLA